MTNWRNIPDGQRVRVTFEADAYEVSKSGITLMLAGNCGVYTSIAPTEADAATWELLPEPLRVGRAKFKMTGVLCDVLALHGKWAWIMYVDGGDLGTSPAEMLVNIDEESQP